MDLNVVIAPLDVKLCKEHQSATVQSCKLIYEFMYEGKWGGVSGSEGIQFVVILHWL